MLTDIINTDRTVTCVTTYKAEFYHFLLDHYQHCTAFCEEETLNNTLAGQLTFSKTNLNQTAYSTNLCPSYSSRVGSPRAFRVCTGDTVVGSFWGEVHLNDCYDQDEVNGDNLQDLEEFLEGNHVTNENVAAVSRDLADVTQTRNALDGEDLVIIADILELITNLNSSSPQVTRNVIEVVDNVLSFEDNVYNESTQSEAPSRIIHNLESQLTNLHRGGENLNFTEVRSFIAVVASTVEEDFLLSEITFGNFFNSEERNIHENLNDSVVNVCGGAGPSILDGVKASITLPTTLLNGIQYDPSDKVQVSFVVYQSSHLFVSRGSSQMSGEVESLIVAATIEGQKIANLENPVVTRFYLLPVEGSTTESSRQCVFWDFSLAGGFGDWSSDGCEVAFGPGGDGDRIVECHCDHLTNFAVLLDIQGDIGNTTLDVLSIIGCVVSIIALVITLISFLAFKKIRSKRPQKVLINLCFALLGLYLSFLMGIEGANFKNAGCVIFGAVIHFFSLASVAWMCVEATIMYLLFVKVFDTGIRHFMRKASFAAWGLPLLVVIITTIAKPNNYSGKYCFPQAGTLTFYLGVLLLIFLMLGYNFIMFALIIRKLISRRKFKDDDKQKELIKQVQNAFAISVLLGIAWVFGFLAIGGAQFIFNLLFLIFNTLEGFFVFVFFCLRNKEVVSAWREKFLSYSESPSHAVKKSVRSHTSIEMVSSANSMSNEVVGSDKEADLMTAAGRESSQREPFINPNPTAHNWVYPPRI